MSEHKPKAVAGDYDTNPDRFRVGSESSRKYGKGDIHESVAERIENEGYEPVLDLGCGEGRLCHLLRKKGVEVIGLDNSRTMLASVLGSRILADAVELPFKENWFGAVVALYMLYHLSNPKIALAESQRVLRKGGLFIAATPSRLTDPELAPVFPRQRTTFDAEDAPSLISKYFSNVKVETWDAPMIHLPDIEAVEAYLFGRGLEKRKCGEAARVLGAPLTVGGTRMAKALQGGPCGMPLVVTRRIRRFYRGQSYAIMYTFHCCLQISKEIN